MPFVSGGGRLDTHTLASGGGRGLSSKVVGRRNDRRSRSDPPLRVYREEIDHPDEARGTTVSEPTIEPLIVVGVDGSNHSKEALRWAVAQAAMTGARVHAVMAWEWNRNPFAINPMAVSYTHL